MIPILFSDKPEPVQLLDRNGVFLKDRNGVDLYARGKEGRLLFDTYGLGALVDCISCVVTEERNGAYELEMSYPATGKHFEDISERCLIFAKPNYSDDPQAFRIHSISTPINGVVSIRARHLIYDLSGIPVMPFKAQNCAAACAGLISNSATTNLFEIVTQISTIADFTVDVPSSVRSWFGGKEGSLLDVYGGEWHYNNYQARLERSRGEDRGVVIQYGRNLIDIRQEYNNENVYTGVIPFWSDEQTGKIINGSLINIEGDYGYTKILCLDLSSDFEEEPTKAEIEARARQYISSNNIGVPKINITLDFAQSNEHVELCDTVTIEFKRFGISAKAKCISAKYDVLRERYTSLEFGDAKSTIADTIYNLQKEEEKAKSTVTNSMLRAINNATSLITGNQGGYVVMRDSDGDGEPDEILVMDTASVETATRVWRWNKSGLGFSASGYSGAFGLALTSNGEIVADFITTGTLSADRIRGGELALGGENNGNGIAKIYDESGNVAVTLNQTGLIINRTATFYAENYSQSDLDTAQSIVLGTTTPTKEQLDKLDIDGDGVISGSDLLAISRLVNGYDVSKTVPVYLQIGNTDTATILSTGGVSIRNGGIYSNNLSCGRMTIYSELTSMGIYNETSSAAANMTILGNGLIRRSSSSSKRYKHDISERLDDDLNPERLYEVPVVQFKYNDDYLTANDPRDGENILGLIAEDVAEALPGAVDRNADGEPEMWNIHIIVPALLKLIQEQHKDIEDLKKRLKEV